MTDDVVWRVMVFADRAWSDMPRWQKACDLLGELCDRIRQIQARPRIREALRDLIDAIPEATLAADPPLRRWVEAAEDALSDGALPRQGKPLDAVPRSASEAKGQQS